MHEADIIQTLLETGWVAANTGSVTPIIDLITNRNDINVRQNHWVLTYNTGAGPIDHSAHKTFDHIWTISIDIRTISKIKFPLICAEVRRIIESKYILPSSGYHRLYMIRDNDLSDRSRGLYRRVIDVALHQDLETI